MLSVSLPVPFLIVESHLREANLHIVFSWKSLLLYVKLSYVGSLLYVRPPAKGWEAWRN